LQGRNGTFAGADNRKGDSFCVELLGFGQ
jgi:hypothetical protein